MYYTKCRFIWMRLSNQTFPLFRFIGHSLSSYIFIHCKTELHALETCQKRNRLGFVIHRPGRGASSRILAISFFHVSSWVISSFQVRLESFCRQFLRFCKVLRNSSGLNKHDSNNRIFHGGDRPLYHTPAQFVIVRLRLNFELRENGSRLYIPFRTLKHKL